MATTIKLKNGSGAPTAGDLVQGEPAIDLTNKRLYTEDSGGSVIEVGSNPSSLSIAGTAVTATATELNTLDGITSTTAELNILDGVTSTAAELNILDGVTASTAELNILDGVTSTAAELNILDGVTSTTAELNILDGVTATAAELNVLDGVTAFVDEDDMSSDSATSIPSQQSVKAYVDAQLTASDLDFQGDSGGALSIDLDSETLTVAGGTGIDTSGATNTLTVAIDSTVTTLTGTQTLTNKTLTSPVISSISNTGTITLPTSTDTLVGRATTDTLTNKTLTSAVLNTGVSGTAVLDEDDMSSDSATQLATQQSIKAYVDSQVASADTLAELTDTNITTPADGALLFYDTTTSKWIDNVVSGDVTIADTGVAAIGSGVIVNDDINASAAISVSKTALTAGTGLTLTTDTLSVDASQTQITAVGTIGTGTWQGSVISDTYVANDLTISGGTIENTVIGAATPAAGTFTTFTSTGIDDNASSTAITISSAGETTFSGDVNLEESTPRILLQDSDVTDSRLQIAMAGATTYVRTRGGTSDYGDVRFQRNNDGSTHLNVFRTTAGGDVLFYDDDGSTEGMRWDSSVSRVGIGLSSPAKTIDMQSTAPSVRFRDTSATTTITDLLTSGANGHIFNMVLDAGNAGTSPSFIIKNYTSELFRFTGTGRLGIGESAPDEELHIKASVPTIKLEDGDGTDQDFRIIENNGQASLIAQNGTSFGNTLFRRDNGTNLYSVLNLTSSGDVDFYDTTGATIGMRWDASTARLGIDDTSPASLLQVGSDTNANADAYITFGKRVASTESNLPFIGQDDPDGGGHNDLGIGVRSSNGTINFYTGNVAAFTAANIRMTIGSAGQIGIGGSNYGTSGQVLTSNGSGSAPSWQDASGGGGSGITEIDNWRLTADITADTDPISSNLERVDDASFAKLGTGMSVSSGIWTFPSTGLWEIGNYLVALLSAADTATIIRTYVSTNGGTNWDESTTSRVGRMGATAWQAGNTVSYVNVTNTTNVKVKFLASSIAAGNAIKGNTTSSQTHFTFIRLGDSQ